MPRCWHAGQHCSFMASHQRVCSHECGLTPTICMWFDADDLHVCGCRIIHGALNYQIYARPSFEIISLALNDPSDRECAAVHARSSKSAQAS